jgi:nucleotide-binding universal stress UspA family protein
MFQHILVPLDGSSRAERAIPVAARLARASGAVITLLRAVAPPSEFAGKTMESSRLKETFDADWAQAADYLACLAASEELSRVKTIMEVSSGQPAQLILAVASSQVLDAPPVDLIIMCSHGRTGFTRWALGSVAQHVARQSPVPVLVLNERGDTPTNLRPDGMHSVRVLVALDGSSHAEAALAPAAQLTAALSAPAQGTLHLVRVLRLPSMYEYGQKDSLAEAKEQGMLEAHAYLSTIKQRLHEGTLAILKLSVTSTVWVSMDVASTLLGIAEAGEDMEDVEAAHGCDVIALATHGRSGPERWVLGSVAEHILGATKLPLLIVRPQKIGDEGEEAGEPTKAAGNAIGMET